MAASATVNEGNAILPSMLRSKIFFRKLRCCYTYYYDALR